MHFHPPARRQSTIDLQPETQALLASTFVDVNAALRDLSQRARVLTGATGVAIALAHKQAMICRASVGNAPSLGSRLDTTSGFSGECVRTGEALRCDDSETDARVDLESCRRLGIRSILAIPIRIENQIVGLMEVFSPKPRAFGDWHLSLLRRLVNGPLLSNSAVTPASPEFLIELEPANKLFVDKPVEVLHQPQPAAVTLPAQFWSDVFVPCDLPWKRFAQSLGLHVVMIAALAGFVRLALHGPRAVPPRFNSSDVLYYSSSEYFGRKRQKLLAPRLKTHRAAFPAEPVISVVQEQKRRIENSVAAPDITLKRDMRTLPATAWSSVAPALPTSAIVRKQFITPTASLSVVAPPPDVSVVGSRHGLAGGTTPVVEPPPSVDVTSRQVADITIGTLQVVSPPPEISNGPNSNPLSMPAGLRNNLAVVIAPSPSLDGIHLPSARAGAGRTATSAPQVVPPPPQLSSAGNSRTHASFHGDLTSVIGPAPSLGGIEGTSAKTRGSLTAGADQVVPPPPQISAGGGSRNWTQPSAGVDVISPPPSLARLAENPGGRVSTRGPASPDVVSLAPAMGSAAAGEPDKPKWTPLPPMEPQISDDNPPANRKELNVAPIVPATALASSSYFGSSEIFIAEERLGVHRKRFIKLVYDYLPYQKRLSEYGPNYPQVAKLRATRDITCDENIATAAYTISQAAVSRTNGSPAQSQDVALDQDRLPCFRTTADDYRRALARHPKSHSSQ